MTLAWGRCDLSRVDKPKCVYVLFAAVLRKATNYLFHGFNLTVDILTVALETWV